METSLKPACHSGTLETSDPGREPNLTTRSVRRHYRSSLGSSLVGPRSGRGLDTQTPVERGSIVSDPDHDGTGLVLCAISGDSLTPDSASGLLGARFPTPDLLHAAADLLPDYTRPSHLGSDPAQRLHLGGGHTLYLAPGVLRLGFSIQDERNGDDGRPRPELARYAAELDSREEAGSDRGIVSAWSARSRSRMLRTLSELDYAPLFDGVPTTAMLTITAPGDWLTVFPTSRAYARAERAFARALRDVWGIEAMIWKREFQRRGAPHTHYLIGVPSGQRRCRCRVCGHKGGGVLLGFAAWVSHRWAHVVGHPDPTEYGKHLRAGTGLDFAEGLRASDPKRLASYFLAHNKAGGGKEYQHRPPAEWLGVDADTGELQGDPSGVGRFWGYRGLSKAVVPVAVSPADAARTARILRRLSERVVWQRPGDHFPHRVDVRTRVVVKPNGRKVTRRARHVRGTSGFLLVNDGAAVASQIARALRPAEGGRWLP